MSVRHPSAAIFCSISIYSGRIDCPPPAPVIAVCCVFCGSCSRVRDAPGVAGAGTRQVAFGGAESVAASRRRCVTTIDDEHIADTVGKPHRPQARSFATMPPAVPPPISAATRRWCITGMDDAGGQSAWCRQSPGDAVSREARWLANVSAFTLNSRPSAPSPMQATTGTKPGRGERADEKRQLRGSPTRPRSTRSINGLMRWWWAAALSPQPASAPVEPDGFHARPSRVRPRIAAS